MDVAPILYNEFPLFLKRYFPYKVQKISLNAGFTCPNRDGVKGYGGCTYCNNQTFNPEYCRTEKSVTQQLEEGKVFFAHKYPEMKYLAYFQAYTNTYGELEALKRKYEEALSVSDVHVAYGTIVGEIKEVSRSYKEARMALDVGKIFFEEKDVIAYSTLGIGRLIYQLPIPLCKMFIKEIFDGKSPDEFDEETLTTINKFFENSLNVSETSRQLYIHRNTLVYRLDKLQKATGLDLRVFEDAITFKIALMVVKYMKYMESLDY